MIKKEKLEKVEELRKSIEDSSVIALVDMYKMPSKQLQEIRKALRGRAEIKMIKKSTLSFAIDNTDKEGVKELESYIPTQPAIVLTSTEAFKFYNFVDSIRLKTFAKEGDVADEDIWVSAGPTPLMAGPAISEFQQAGIPASIESGRITIRKDKCLVKKGEEISAIKANVLRKLKIEPMKVTLNIVAIYDKGNVYKKEALELTKVFPQMLARAFNNALNLSIFIAFPTNENIKHLIAKAVRAASTIKDLIGEPSQKEISTDKIDLQSKEKENQGGAS